ncbi:hypothetical protein A3C18_03735 [Candidatus Kaiserbacteria bacterium RIFCSPHIGHO2_02_FULL_54_11b]|uniref:Addiction module toxin, HicA family n=2 Tax=Candidatus Kaiseribacteriota TaxID=1752734 RepID=A0A1F6CPJ5_9BACT|nr:MAG: hypothetical protein A2704_02850 [Candidatus Kaiserbacteria bacterium RIFCSPHIGHO2_01_FULL_54_36b]OGG64250.1 MAG: hypothetical protein A3C18_03735 [Candidatus Kaiserbacteria bacterium RIFCSPHIGHO2_02_FULL_54_11b]
MAGVTARKLCVALERHDFVFRRQAGSHWIFFRAADKRRVTVPMHPGDLHISTLHSILKQAGLSLGDI